MRSAHRFSLAAWTICLSLFALSLQGCLEADPTPADKPIERPKGDNQIAVTGPRVLLSLPPSAIAAYQNEAQSLRLSLYVVENGLRGELVTTDVYSLRPEGLYTLGVLGQVSFEADAELLDAAGEVLALGSFRATSAEKGDTNLELALRPSTLLTVPLELSALISQEPAANVPAPIVEPAAVRSALKDSACLGCHSKASPRARLDLESFPYISTGGSLRNADLLKITQTIAARMGDTVRPMPPAPMPAAAPAAVAAVQEFAGEIARMKEEAASAEGAAIDRVAFTLYLTAETRISAELKKSEGAYRLDKGVVLKPAQNYNYDLQAFAADGSLLFELKQNSLNVPANGQVSLELKVPAPSRPVAANEDAGETAPPSL